MTATEWLVLPWTGRWEAAGVKVSVDFEENYVKVRTEWAETFGKYQLTRKVSIDKEEKEYMKVLTGKRNVWRLCGGVFSVCYFKSCRIVWFCFRLFICPLVGCQKARPPSVEDPKLSEVQSFVSQLGQTIALHDWPSARHSAFLVSVFWSRSAPFFPNPLPTWSDACSKLGIHEFACLSPNVICLDVAFTVDWAFNTRQMNCSSLWNVGLVQLIRCTQLVWNSHRQMAWGWQRSHAPSPKHGESAPQSKSTCFEKTSLAWSVGVTKWMGDHYVWGFVSALIFFRSQILRSSICICLHK